jgi:hypothetical protein
MFRALAVLSCSLAACAKREPSNVEPRSALGQAAHDIVLTSETVVVSARVAVGATLASILRAENVAAGDAAQLIARAASVFDLRKVHANQPYRLERTLGGLFRKFEYEIDADRYLRISRSHVDVPGSALEVDVLPIPKTREVQHVTGNIDRTAPSLVAAVDAAGETIDLTLAIAEILGGEIDFSTELQPDDRFDVTVEKQFRDAHAFAGYGPVLAVEFVNAGRRAGGCRGGWRGSVRRVGGSIRPPRASAACQRIRIRVSAPVVDCRSLGDTRAPGRAHRTRWIERSGDWSPPRLSPEKERRLHQSRDSSPRDATGGACSSRRKGRVRGGKGPGVRSRQSIAEANPYPACRISPLARDWHLPAPWLDKFLWLT